MPVNCTTLKINITPLYVMEAGLCGLIYSKSRSRSSLDSLRGQWAALAGRGRLAATLQFRGRCIGKVIFPGSKKICIPPSMVNYHSGPLEPGGRRGNPPQFCNKQYIFDTILELKV